MFSHFGLYFTPQQAQEARDNANRAPFEVTWKTLRETNQLEPMQAMLWNGLRFRFDDNLDAGEFTLNVLEDQLSQPPDHTAFWNYTAQTLCLAQGIELVRDHPAKSDGLDGRWCDLLLERAEWVNANAHAPNLAETLWVVALNMASGIVLEHEDMFEQAVASFQETIDNDVHPQGYLQRVIDSTSGAQSLLNHLRSVQALVLMAEMARCVEVDLWGYANRGVSITTATTYPLYYYFYPEKWKWVEERFVGGKKVDSEVLNLEETQRMFKNNAGFLEMLNHHYGKQPLRAVRMILDELRPVNDLYGGGLTTLTHGVAEGRRGLFG